MQVVDETSARGTVYYSRRLGGLRVTILENRNRANDDDALHLLMLGEAAPFQLGASSKPTAERQTQPQAEPQPPPDLWDASNAANGAVKIWSKPKPPHRPVANGKAKTHQIAGDAVPF